MQRHSNSIFDRLNFFHHILQATLIVHVFGLACTRSSDSRTPTAEITQAGPSREQHDLSKLAVADFATDGTVRHRILYMSLEEAAARLGSARFVAQATFRWMGDTETNPEFQDEAPSPKEPALSQTDKSNIAIDARGNAHIRLNNERYTAEMYLVGNDALLKFDRGKLRRLNRRMADTHVFTHAAFSGMRQSLELFGPWLTFKNPVATTMRGRETLRFPLQLNTKSNERPLLLTPDAANQHAETRVDAIAPKARWRETATPIELTASLWIDAQTGVPIRLELRGKIESRDAELGTQTLAVDYTGELSDIGRVSEIKTQGLEIVDDFRVASRDRDPLSFFRAHALPEELPVVAEETEKEPE